MLAKNRGSDILVAMHQHLCMLGVSLLLIGCLSPGEARLPGGTYHLQPAADAPLLDEWQEVETTDQRGTRKLLVHVLNRPGMTRLTLLEPASLATLLRCDFDGTAATRSGPLFAENIPAELPLAVLQLSRWPRTSVSRGLSGDLSITDDGVRRTIWSGSEVFAHIEECPDRQTAIQLPGQGTTIRIRKADQR